MWKWGKRERRVRYELMRVLRCRRRALKKKTEKRGKTCLPPAAPPTSRATPRGRSSGTRAGTVVIVVVVKMVNKEEREREE